MNIRRIFQGEEWKKTPEFTALISAVVYGLLVHSFALNNILHNHDNIASQPGGYGIGVPLGRWVLEILGLVADKAGLNYNLPSVNGYLYIGILALTAAFLVSVLRIRSRGYAALAGALFVSFPTVTATMIFRYTAVFYGISALCAVLAVWILRRFRWGLAASAVLIAVSLGIYQAYAPLTIALFVLQLICEGLRGEADAGKLVLRGLYDCLALILGLILYFAGLKLCNVLFDVSLMDYRGIDTMGTLSLSQLPRLVGNALRSVCMLPLQDYCGVANRMLMRLSYLALAGLTGLMMLRLMAKQVKNAVASVIICLLCVAFWLAVGFIEIMVADSWIYTLMVYSFSLLACMPLAVMECFPEEESIRRCGAFFRKAVGVLVAGLVFFYGYYANVNYTAVYYSGEQIDNYLSGIVLRATMTEGYTTDKEWALIGEIQDPLMGGPWNNELSYTGMWFTEHEVNQYSRNNWIQNYIGYDLPMADSEKVKTLAASEEVQAMPCYPNAGSIRVIGDAVVVKFQETAE